MLELLPVFKMNKWMFILYTVAISNILYKSYPFV
jgi:hypothetical protein